MEDKILLTLLLAYILGSFILTLSYLHYRRCSLLEYFLWGAVAFVLPILGPFFVIAARPGPKKRVWRTVSTRPAINSKG